jgi:hypothetical protein
MGVNYYFKDTDTEKYLLYTINNDREHIHGEYGDLKSLSAATTWISKYSHSKFKIKKVRVEVKDVPMSTEELDYINKMAQKKGIELV